MSPAFRLARAARVEAAHWAAASRSLDARLERQASRLSSASPRSSCIAGTNLLRTRMYAPATVS